MKLDIETQTFNRNLNLEEDEKFFLLMKSFMKHWNKVKL